MNPQLLKTELLNSTAQIIVFDDAGNLLSSCDTLFHITSHITYSLYSEIPVLESLQYSLAELEPEDELKFPCMWFDSFGASGYYDFTFIRKKLSFIWLIQDFTKIYSDHIHVQQERNQSILTSELLELHRQTEEELRKVEKEFKYLFDNSLELIQSISPNGKFIFVNQSWLTTLKYTKEEVANMSFLDIIHPDDHPHCTHIFKKLNKTKNIKDVDVRFIDKNGGVVYVSGNLNSNIFNKKLIATQGIFRNITARKLIEDKLKQSEALYRLLVENANDIIFMTNSNGEITYMNDIGLKFTGNSEEEIKSVHFTEWVHPDYKLKIKDFYFNQFEKKENNTYQEFPLVVKNETVWVGQNVNLLFNIVDGKECISGFLVIARDITKQKQLEDALNNSNAILDKKVKKRTSALNQSNQELTHVNKELDIFLYKSSHNLKGPIARISGLSSLMKLKSEKPNLLNYLDYIDKEVSGMNNLTDQLTSYHSIYSSNPLNLIEKIDLEKLISSLLNTKLTNYCRYSLNVANNVHLISNTSLLTLALGNILANSFQFKKEEIRDHIVGITVKMEKNWVEITIRDNGEGISKDLLKDIFNMFFKASQNQYGHGLGLYLVKKAVEKLGGKINVISAEGEFTEFKIVLPANL